MPTVTFDVVVTQEGNILEVEATRGSDVVKSRLLTSEVTTLEELAAWVLNQAARTLATDAVLQKRLTVTFHTQQVPDPETGKLLDTRVIDSVAAEPLPEDEGKTNFRNLPGWATWTGDEAATWIEVNVTNLASAKVALEAMARAIVFLRDMVVGD
jgi:hypothetical protein